MQDKPSLFNLKVINNYNVLNTLYNTKEMVKISH